MIFTLIRDWSGEGDNAALEPIVFVIEADDLMIAWAETLVIGDREYAHILDGYAFEDATYGVMSFHGDITTAIVGQTNFDIHRG